MSGFPEAREHGTITKVADGVHCVRGTFRMGPGVVIPRTMTVLDTGDGLAVLNSVRMTDEGMAALDALGKVKHLVKLSDSHGIDDAFYADRYRPKVWTLPGAKLEGLASSATLGPEGPIEGGIVHDFGETAGWREAAYHVPMAGGTLLTCDSLQNCADTEGASFLGRVTMSMMGFKGGVVVPPMWRKFQKVKGTKVTATFAPIAEKSFDTFISGHGPALSGRADRAVRSAIERAAAS